MLALAIVAALIGGIVAAPQRLAVSAEPATQQQIDAGVPVVELAGTPQEIGTSHGRQLGESIHVLHEKYLKVFMSGRARQMIAMAAATAYQKLMLPAHQTELKSLAAQVGYSEAETMLAQCFLDITPRFACSTITLPADASPDGVARFGRNLDFPSLNVADKYSVLFIVRPEGKYAFASIGWPGLIGVLSGMNEHGLALANMEVDRGPRMPSAMPYTMLYRSILENCCDVNEAIAFLEKTPRQTANNLMLMDAAGNRAVAEITPQSVHVRRGENAKALISTNHQRDQDQDKPGFCRRYDRLHDASAKNFGSINEKSIEAMLAGVGGKHTLQAMVFEPANRVIYLSTGHSAAKGEYKKIDLAAVFAK